MTIGDDPLDLDNPSFFEFFGKYQPGFFILEIHDSCAQDISVAVLPHPGDHENSLGDVPCSVPNFVV